MEIPQSVRGFRSLVEDARRLLEFGIGRGQAIDDGILLQIRRAEDLLVSVSLPAAPERVALDRAYRDLAALMAPVTVETLRATTDVSEGQPWYLAPWGPVSEAKIWSRKLWLFTAIVIALSVLSVVSFAPPATGESAADAAPRHWASLTPFLFGALGALAYLLRSCHEYIHRREFDPKRIPEYYNRILLGIVSGGAMLLLPLDGVKLPAEALAFIAGYNTDFLFTAIERIAAAILPKVVASATAPAAAAPARTQPAAADAAAVAEAAVADLYGSDTFDLRVQVIQSFLRETGVPAYAPGERVGYWDERTRAGAIAFLSENYGAIPELAHATPAPDFRAMDRERLISLMNYFVVGEGAAG